MIQCLFTKKSAVNFSVTSTLQSDKIFAEIFRFLYSYSLARAEFPAKNSVNNPRINNQSFFIFFGLCFCKNYSHNIIYKILQKSKKLSDFVDVFALIFGQLFLI
jgi:hypothetical protein